MDEDDQEECLINLNLLKSLKYLSLLISKY